jgi:hypothetical protein
MCVWCWEAAIQSWKGAYRASVDPVTCCSILGAANTPTTFTSKEDVASTSNAAKSGSLRSTCPSLRLLSIWVRAGTAPWYTAITRTAVHLLKVDHSRTPFRLPIEGRVRQVRLDPYYRVPRRT